jgi:2-haloacid dehalogenase
MRIVVRLLATAALCAAVVAALPAVQRLRGNGEDGPRPRFSAVAFDYFVLFNPDSIVRTVERLYPGRGREFTSTWRDRQFEYSWLRAITNRYTDFSGITEDALVYTANALHLDLSTAQKRQLLDAYLNLTPWPDTAAALGRLRAANVRVITIANFTPAMLRANAEHARLTPLFDAFVSTDANHTYKPDPRAYRLGMDQLRLAKEDVVFAAFGGWDAAGAKSFGYPTVWVNRFAQPEEQLGVHPDRTVTDLAGLLEFVMPAAGSRGAAR